MIGLLRAPTSGQVRCGTARGMPQDLLSPGAVSGFEPQSGKTLGNQSGQNSVVSEARVQ